MTKRKGGHDFDPVKSINELISNLEKMAGHHVDGEPGAACEAILSQARDAFGKFERAVAALHSAGQTAAVEIIVGDIERCVRRAVRTAVDYGVPCAPQAATASSNASAVRTTPRSTNGRPLTTSQGDVSDGL
ncbi:hypothetical protein [Dyella sp.]|uniref:hypothetical protein n=1 Tax=Dyella sp. TaxID=1869338 RepID=UPI002840F357|nr:hypothetical protein [Dyella sp.]MDR3446264.1 hypothetical protein [Dyella sp.]